MYVSIPYYDQVVKKILSKYNLKNSFWEFANIIFLESTRNFLPHHYMDRGLGNKEQATLGMFLKIRLQIFLYFFMEANFYMVKKICGVILSCRPLLGTRNVLLLVLK